MHNFRKGVDYYDFEIICCINETIMIRLIFFLGFICSNNLFIAQANAYSSPTCFIISPDGKTIFIGNTDSSAVIMDATSGQVLKKITRLDGKIDGAEFSPDNKKVAAVCKHKIKFFDIETGNTSGEINNVEVLSGNINYSRDGKYVTLINAGQIEIWETETLKIFVKIKSLAGDYFIAACFSFDGKSVFASTLKKSIQKWIIGYDQPVGSIIKHKGFVNDVRLSNDGKYLITISTIDSEVFVWNAKDFIFMYKLQDTSVPSEVRFSNDGNKLLTNGTITKLIFNLSNGSKIGELFDEQDFVSMRNAVFSNNNNEVFIVYMDNIIKLWDIVKAKVVKTFQY
jgi:WD40 repeat protein